MNRIALISVFMSLALQGSIAQPRKARIPFQLYKNVEPEHMITNIRDLSSPAFEGRELGTDGNDKAVDWVSFKLEQTGIAPLFESQFTQDFPITRYELGSDNYILLGSDSLALYKDFLPAYYSTDAHLGAHIVYAGFGFNVLKGHPLKDKIVVMHGITDKQRNRLAYISSDSLPWLGLTNPLFFEQAKWAEKQGAAAVIFVPEEGEFEPPFENGAPYQFQKVIKLPAKARKSMAHSPSPYVSRERLNISVLYASHAAGLRIMQISEETFRALTENARKGIVPADQIFFRNALVGTKLLPVERRFASNVGGIIHGKFGSPYLLITANIDQEGQHPTLGYPYLGANSNASGVTVLLEIASMLQKWKDQPEYGIVFLIHNGGERDLIGLREFFSRNSSIAKKIKGALLLNDMASGPILDSIHVFIDTSAHRARFHEELYRTLQDYALEPLAYSGGLSPARNVRFFSDANVPAFELRSGINTLENRVSDASDRLNYVKMYRMTQLSLELVWRYNYVRNSVLVHETH